MIPGEVLEAVEIDGASFIQKTMYVTIPMMKSTILWETQRRKPDQSQRKKAFEICIV